MKTLTLICFCILAPVLLAGKEAISLFNGKNLSGWTLDTPARDGMTKAQEVEMKDGIMIIDTRKTDWWAANPPSFMVRDGLLVSMGNPRGHLITKKSYSNYKLVVEYRFTRGPGNCGVLVHSSTPRRLYDMFPQSIEVQMQHEHAGDFWCIGENIEVPNMKERRPVKDDQKYGGDAGDARRILNLTDGDEAQLGEWNTMEIECRGDEIIVHVNGNLVNHGYNSTATSGQIALQAEGTEVEFRKVQLTPLAN